MKKMKVVIIDYQMSNIFSVQHAFSFVGLDTIISSDKDCILTSDAVILPGVGAFGEAVNNLRRLDLIEPIKDFIKSGKPFMGICLGMQLLMSESEEFGKYKGLGVIDGKVVKFPNTSANGYLVKVPQVGWNSIYPSEMNNDWIKTPLKGISSGEFMYFVHSFYVVPQDSSVVSSMTEYCEINYCSSLLYKNVFATQFHPEKSANEGLKIYKNWSALIQN